LDSEETKGLKVGAVVISDQHVDKVPAMLVVINEGPGEYGKKLYEIFRMADEKNLDLIIYGNTVGRRFWKGSSRSDQTSRARKGFRHDSHE
jgi:hypothetical protein